MCAEFYIPGWSDVGIAIRTGLQQGQTLGEKSKEWREIFFQRHTVVLSVHSTWKQITRGSWGIKSAGHYPNGN